VRVVRRRTGRPRCDDEGGLRGAPLRSWVAGGQALATATEDAPDFVRARRLVALCLGPARRNPQVRAIQKGLMDMGGG
jgi:hypothetical protein